MKKSQDIWKWLFKENYGIDKRFYVITESQKFKNSVLGLEYHSKRLHFYSIV